MVMAATMTHWKVHGGDGVVIVNACVITSYMAIISVGSYPCINLDTGFYYPHLFMASNSFTLTTTTFRFFTLFLIRNDWMMSLFWRVFILQTNMDTQKNSLVAVFASPWVRVAIFHQGSHIGWSTSNHDSGWRHCLTLYMRRPVEWSDPIPRHY